MKSLVLSFAALFYLTPIASLAQSWSGYLVDSRCYDAEERNLNPFAPMPELNRDKDQEIVICTPSSKTKSFAVVEQDGMTSFKLDPVGNERANILVRKTGKKSFRVVTVTGEMKNNIIDLDSISEIK